MESSGWELHKENIQPLSSGRNISLLKHSLDTSKSLADHDADIEQHVSELENNIQQYIGDDPIEPYLALVRFLEQQCLQSITWKKSLATARIECYKTFYDNPKYENDKRYVDAIIKCLHEAVPESGRRLNSLLQCLNSKGIGRTVSQMYMVIADLQESCGKANEARQTLKLGIENDAQPIEKLQETLSELEFRIARDLAKTMNVVGQTQPSGDSRNFGSSVPVYGEKNDAPVFRNDLNPAPPVLDRQLSGTKLQKMSSSSQIPLFCNENENEHKVSERSSSSSSSSRNIGFNVMENVIEPKSDKENKLNPSKWNKPEVIVEPEPRPFEATPREKITIFTDEISEVRSHLRRSVQIQEGVLKERKPDPEISEDFQRNGVSTDNNNSKSVGDGSSLPSTSAVSTVVSQETASNSQQQQQQQVSVVNSSGIDASSSAPVDNNAPMIIPNARLMCCRSFLPSGNPASFEHRHREAWRKKNQDKEIIAQLQKDKLDLENKLCNRERELEQIREVEQSLRDNFEAELKQKSIKEGQWEQQKYSYKDTIAQITAGYSELKEHANQLRFQQKESAKMMAELQSRHEQELEEIQSTHEARVEELMTQIQQLQMERAQLQQQQQQSSVDSTNSNNNTGSLQRTSASSKSSSNNDNECTFFIKPERSEEGGGHHYNNKILQSSNRSIMALPTDKLFNATGMSMMESFMAPPSRVVEMSGTTEINISPEPSSFNASVKMSGATTVYGWRGDDDKTRFGGFNVSDACGGDSPIMHQSSKGLHRDTTGNDTAPNAPDISIGIAPVMLPPPPSVSKKFVLYESMADSHSMTRGSSGGGGGRKPVEFQRQQEKPPQGVDFRTLSENVAPITAAPTTNRPPLLGQPRVSGSKVPSSTTSVSARIAEIEALSNSGLMEHDDENRAVRNSRDTAASESNYYPSTVGQTFTRPLPPPSSSSVSVPRRQTLLSTTATASNQNYNNNNNNEDDDDDEPPFEPFVPSPAPPPPSVPTNRHYQPPELPFDISNLTSALQFGPPPLLNSTPTRSTTFSGIRRVQQQQPPPDVYSGNYVHTQRIPRLSEIYRDIEGPMSPRTHNDEYERDERDNNNMDWMQDRAQRMTGFHSRIHEPQPLDDHSMMQNLSPIQETSKENRSSCTTGSSSSGNMTTRGGGHTMSGVSMFNSNSRSVSGVANPRSVSSSSSRSIRFTSQNQ